MIPKYQLFRKDRGTDKGGGCMIYLHCTFAAELLDHPRLTNVPESLRLSVSETSSQILLGCVYNPPSASVTILTLTFEYATEMPHRAKIIAGDFNLPKTN
ncbi:unnamed protein product [Dicrocoelium dendriticum]|nr:unnamed protein product [Dicrocoelium dendriticum]